MSRSLRVGIDIGGTFTDLTLLDTESGTLRHHKVPSTPSAPSDALIAGVIQMTEEVGATPADLEYFVHGTTLALNTLLQRRGSRLALIVGHTNRSVLDLARLRVPEQFSFTPSVPEPLVEPLMVRSIGGRLLADGSEDEPLDTAEIDSLPDWLREVGAESCAISLLNAYANPEHEARIAAVIRAALPEMPVSASSEVWPEIREYERTMVTTMNAYVAGQMGDYFKRLRQQLDELEMTAPPLITRSNGGLMSIEEAAELPVETLISGPAAGVVGARFAAELAGIEDCITFDMGGTSADVSVIRGGRAARSSEAAVGDFPVVIPAVDVAAIGAGGGSIAWLDRAGVLKVGPSSAGADPGPACYGRGGEQPTVTDAYLLCGYLDPADFAEGQIELRTDLARAAVGALGADLGLDPEQTAEAMIRIATATMAARLGPLMAGLGVDPREFALLPYGGAGPLHANLLARELGMRRILVPGSPGTLCATGALVNDLSRDWVRTFRGRVAAEVLGNVDAEFVELERTAREWIEAQPIAVSEAEISLAIDMRYVGQAYELEVAIDRDDLAAATAVAERFHARHESVHHHADREAAVEIVNLRAHAVGRTGQLPEPEAGSPATGGDEVGRREIVIDGKKVTAGIHRRQSLAPGAAVPGPAIVTQPDTTTLVLPGYTARIDAATNMVIAADD
jgi:N-methylhydantoinase A